MWNQLFGSVNRLQSGLDAAWMRNDVIANNIANADTPGFRASKVEFESAMKAALGTEQGRLKMAATHAGHITSGASSAEDVVPTVTTDESRMRYDENGVSPETEMAELAKNSIQYYAMVNKMNAELNQLNAAINIT